MGPDDNFFDLGGHSLKAAALRQAIRETLDLDVPLSAFFAETTPAALCAWLEERGVAGTDASLLVLRPGRPGEPELVLVHEVSGGVLEYLDLCRVLEPATMGVRGLVAPGYDNDEPALDTVEALAERYVAELVAAEVAEPYRLAGWSFGGLVAFEMVRRLEAMGRRVEPLLLLDARPFGEAGAFSPADAVEQMAERLGIDLSPARGASPDAARVLLRDRIVARGLVAASMVDRVLDRQLAVLEAHGRAIARYRPSGQVRTNLILFEARERGDDEAVDVRAWERRTGGRVRTVPVAGNHLTMVRPPYVATLAEALEAEIAGLGERLR